MKNRKIFAVSAVTLGVLAGAAVFWWQPQEPGRSVHIEPARGQLLDFRGTALTAAEVVWQPAVNMEALNGYPRSSVSRFIAALARELGVERGRISSLGDEYWSRARERQVPVRVTESRAQQIRVWLSSSEWRESPRLIRFFEVPGRLYPHREAVAGLVGFVNRDGQGQEGMERELDGILKEGRDARLSIDIDLQRALADRMQRAIDAHDLREAGAVVIELDSRRIAAILSLPSFDPANYQQRSGPQVRLRPVTDIFQAGPLLQPFFLNEVLGSALDAAPELRGRFVQAEIGAGMRMVSRLGYESARRSLLQADLLSPLDIGFPGASVTHERRYGANAEIEGDLGNGAGIALNLVRYSASLATLIDARSSLVPRLHQVSAAPERPLRTPQRDAQTQLLRAALIERARLQSGNTSADFGGMWANYRDLVKEGEPVQRAAIVLFAPAAQPRYLLTMTFVTQSAIPERELLSIGKDALMEALHSGEVADPRLVASN